MDTIIRKRTRLDAQLSPGNNIDSEDNFLKQLDLSLDNLKKAIEQITNVLPSATTDQQPILQAMLSGLSANFSHCSAMVTGLKNKLIADPVEDKERSRSVVLINLPESKNEVPSKRVEHDRLAVTCILNKLGIEVAPVAHYRMGRPKLPASNGARLVKVVFPASIYLRLTLGRWKMHRDTIKAELDAPKLLIRPSLSPEERAREREQRARARMRQVEQNEDQAQSQAATGLFSATSSLLGQK